MFPKVAEWRKGHTPKLFVNIDKEVMGWSTFFIGRNSESGALYFFNLLDAAGVKKQTRRKRRKRNQEPETDGGLTAIDEGKLISLAVTLPGIELMVSQTDKTIIGIHFIVTAKFAELVDNELIQGKLDDVVEVEQPTFDECLWSKGRAPISLWPKGCALIEDVRADYREISSKLSTDALMMTWYPDVEWHRISDWFYIATNKESEFSGFAAINLSKEMTDELVAINSDHPLPKNKADTNVPTSKKVFSANW